MLFSAYIVSIQVVYYCDGNLGVTFLSALRKINMQASKKRKDMLSKESYIFVSQLHCHIFYRLGFSHIILFVEFPKIGYHMNSHYLVVLSFPTSMTSCQQRGFLGILHFLCSFQGSTPRQINNTVCYFCGANEGFCQAQLYLNLLRQSSLHVTKVVSFKGHTKSFVLSYGWLQVFALFSSTKCSTSYFAG